MKRILVSVFLALIIVLSFVVPTSAAPTTENWTIGGINKNGFGYAYYTLNVANLQVDSFTIVNGTTTETLEIRIFQHDSWASEDMIFSMSVGPLQTVTTPIYNFKFHKEPGTGNPPGPDTVEPPPGTMVQFRN